MIEATQKRETLLCLVQGILKAQWLLASGTGTLPTPSAAPVGCLKGPPMQSGITGEFQSWLGPPELSVLQGGPGVWVTSLFAAHAIPGRKPRLVFGPPEFLPTHRAALPMKRGEMKRQRR